MHTIVGDTDSLTVCWISLEYKYVITIILLYLQIRNLLLQKSDKKLN